MREYSTQERIIHEDAPEPAQIKRLAAVGTGSAASRQRLKSLNRSKRAHYFVEEIDFLAESEEGAEEYPQEIRHRMAGRVGLTLVNGYSKLWSLSYFDTLWVNSEGAGWQAARALYRFKWDRRQTLLAQRSMRFIGVDGGVDLDLADEIDQFKMLDDEAAFWSVQEDFSRVTADECEILIKDSQEYFSVIESRQASR